MSVARPLPRVDADGAPYWEAAGRHELRIQRCDECGTTRFYPRVQCPKCWSDQVTWIEASGEGTIASWSLIRRAPFPGLADRAPYVVALVDLPEEVRVFSHIAGAKAEEAAVGAAVVVDFEAISEDVTLPVFRLASSVGRE
jgi:uncharacterized OB-fold protein